MRKARERKISKNRREKADNALQARNQHINGSVGMYIEYMSYLFKRADPNMTKEKKLSHLMRGVKQELFAEIVRNPPLNVAEFRTEVTTIEKAMQQRAHNYNRDVSRAPADHLSAGPGSNTQALRELVRSIVKEELRILQLPQVTPTASTLAALNRDKVWYSIRQPGFEATPVHLEKAPQVRSGPAYADVLCQTTVHNAPFAAPSSPLSAVDPF